MQASTELLGVRRSRGTWASRSAAAFRPDGATPRLTGKWLIPKTRLGALRLLMALPLAAAVLAAMPAAAASRQPDPFECGAPTRDGWAAWQRFRELNGLPLWPGPMPQAGGPNVLASDDKTLLLLVGGSIVALFTAPSASGGGALIGLMDRRYGIDLLRPKDPSHPAAWQLCLGDLSTDPDSCQPGGLLLQSPSVSGSWAATTENGAPALEMSWNGVDGDVAVTTRYFIRDGALHGRIIVRDGDKNERGIVYARFPELNGVGRPLGDSVSLVLPRYNLGIVCEACGGVAAYYPSLYQSMPWFGYLTGSYALYIGAHDPSGQIKRFNVAGPGDSGQGASWVELYPESSGTPGNLLAPAWDFVIAPLCADLGWPVLADVYRGWVTTETEWGRAPRLDQRLDIPEDIRTGAWWFAHSTDRQAPVQVLKDASLSNRRDLSAVPTVHHWYGWHDPGMDRGFPNFRPKPGTAEAIAAVQQAGGLVVPYVNGALTDQSSAPIATGRPAHCDTTDSVYPEHWNDTVVRPGGARGFGQYSSGACLVRMNPLAPSWRNTLKTVVDEVVNQLGARGVYIDVLGNAFPGSWDRNGHPPGRGTWVTASDRDLLRLLKPKAALVVVEGALEQMSGLASAGVNYERTTREMAPLFMAVYHDRFILAGLRSLAPDDEAALAIKNGVAVAWGLQPGLNNIRWRQADRGAAISWANTLIRARRQLKDWLAYGDLLLPLPVGASATSTVVISRSWCDRVVDCKPASFERPAVEAVLYRSPGGEDRIVYVNMATVTASHVVKLPRYLQGRVATVFQADGTRLGAAQVLATGAELHWTAPPRSVGYIAFGSPGSTSSPGKPQLTP